MFSLSSVSYNTYDKYNHSVLQLIIVKRQIWYTILPFKKFYCITGETYHFTVIRHSVRTGSLKSRSFHRMTI